MEKQRIAEIVLENRTRLGFTQTELSEKTGISLRSIQRIEKGEVKPRAYSLRMLATELNCSFEEGENTPQPKTVRPKSKLPAKIILSAGSFFSIILIALAFISQSSTFPETEFEAQLYWLCILIIIIITQWIIWMRYGTDESTT